MNSISRHLSLSFETKIEFQQSKQVKSHQSHTHNSCITFLTFFAQHDSSCEWVLTAIR